ncbi:mechanosensitive ion channel family protein [Algoriphagus lacus]|uniref:Mechanosensitive ion channel family protein n=1 Tax=Algoriphagus lacus TaxID=2056311 RepID=A0A418PW73_9BACT|nr:mechanosensitive ion channel domain-containing protein [Algoriphagus lacus]RIW18325.1 mechanosensitive ion channel family protein [Algoriphagus lacus]
MEKFNAFPEKVLNWLIDFGPNLISAIAVLVIGMTIINWASRILSQAMDKKSVDSSLRTFVSSMVSIGLKVLLLITAAGMLGIQTTSFVAIIGALGLAVGLALQGSLGNFAGGVLILIFKPFKPGELIESNGQTGVVKEIQIFNTILLTPENKTVILANGAVSNNTIINYSRHGNLRVDINMAISPSMNIEKAKTVAMEVLKANEKVLKDPAPSVNVLKVGDGMVTLAIRPYADESQYWDVFFSLQEEIKVAFDQNEIEGPIPTRLVINKNQSSTGVLTDD